VGSYGNVMRGTTVNEREEGLIDGCVGNLIVWENRGQLESTKLHIQTLSDFTNTTVREP
jgi:hypothetical protein